MSVQTSTQFDHAVATCKDIFINKMRDYGSAWRILRVRSITDQILIKAQRIRSIEEKGTQRVDEGVTDEYKGIINYCVIALVQLELGTDENYQVGLEDAGKYFDKHTAKAKSLMENKNHDYDEAWRQMRISSMTDLILMKLLRVKQIEDNKGETIISEGIEANYYDIMNYSIFALIKMEEVKK